MLNPTKARMLQYIATDPYDDSVQVAMVEDCKHCFKKIRNSILSSSTSGKTVRTLMWKSHLILWEYFERAYHFNNQTDLHLYKHLSRDHTYSKLHEKMQNHLAENVLNADMLNLFKVYQKTLHNPSKLNIVIALLEHTSVFVQIFSSVTSKIQSMYDDRLR